MLGFYPTGSAPISAGRSVPSSGIPAPDIIDPQFTGELTETHTSDSITISWAGTTSADDVAVARREYRIGGSGAYTAASAGEEVSKSHTFLGLSASTAHQVDVRVVDTSGNVSDPLTLVVATSAAPPADDGTLNYIRYTLGTRREGVLHLNLATVHWSLFAQLLPKDFEAPVAKGTHMMTAGSPLLEIAVPAAIVPDGWYMLVLSDDDGTTTVACPVLVA